MAELEISTPRRAPGDSLGVDLAADELPTEEHPLDSEEARQELRWLLRHYYLEKETQSTNRLEMAIDGDTYDGIQWDEEDAEEVRNRGQMPLVYNEVAPMVDWVIGTERRTRVDWSVLPRAEDDVKDADVKSKVLKYVSDINRVPFNRSRAFADAIKCGVGWVDDGARDDPTQDILYSKYEDWRNVLWDSRGYELDLSDSRYLFRWRWVDEDVAMSYFPDRADQIRRAADEFIYDLDDDAEWGEAPVWNDAERAQVRAIGSGTTGEGRRRRVKLIEAQYRKPAQVQIVDDGPLKGLIFVDSDKAMAQALHTVGGSLVDKTVMRVHMAVMTEGSLLSMGPSVYRHNRFTLTPIWCYRRGRDRLPYGVIRRVRDIQQDLNKRASKALFLLNSNQIIADKGAVDDVNVARDEANRPDGYIEKAAGKEFNIRRDSEMAHGQVQMMALDAQSIQKSAGVSDENLGRQTNAVSGEAIKARQLQGSVVTTEPFDNLRLAVQVSGEKQLSLVEQFYTEEKVIRLTGEKAGQFEWVKINTPEIQPDGSVRFINDITASTADFVVSEKDYAGTMRQVMFESLNALAARLPPEIALRLMTVAMKYSDLPNKDQVSRLIAEMSGWRDPEEELTLEEMQALQAQAQAQAEAEQMRRQAAVQAIEEQAAKIREIHARADKLEAEAMAAGQNPGGRFAQVRSQASAEIDRLSEQLRRAKAELADQRFKVQTEADAKVRVANINADAAERVAEIKAASNARLDRLNALLNA